MLINLMSEDGLDDDMMRKCGEMDIIDHCSRRGARIGYIVRNNEFSVGVLYWVLWASTESYISE